MPQYRIKPGASFCWPNASVQTAGAVIELPEDVAAMHASLLDPVPPTPTPTPPATAKAPRAQAD